MSPEIECSSGVIKSQSDHKTYANSMRKVSERKRGVCGLREIFVVLKNFLENRGENPPYCARSSIG